MKAKLSTLLPPLLASLVLSAGAQSTPSLMSYQARVTDAGGALIGNSSPVNRTVGFRLYSAATGGTALYVETQTVTISGGEFSVLIGNGTGVTGTPGPSAPASPIRKLDAVLNATAYEALYLGITVDDGVESTVDAEISPRQQMVSGAFALRAKVAESVKNQSVTTDMLGLNSVTLNQLGTDAVNSGKIVDGSIVTSDIGNNAVTSAKLDSTTIGFWTPSGSNVYRNGNVGIGESNPGFPLNFGTANGDKISLSGNSGNTYGFGVATNALQIHTGASTGNILFGYGSSAAMTETMRITGTGNVGIGSVNPQAKLDILGAVTLNGTAGRNYFKDSGKSDGSGLRVGEAWSMYGVYAETGTGVLGGAGGASLQNNALFVSTGGNVGIGTTSPGMRLSIADGAADGARYGSVQITRETSNHTAAHLSFVRAGSAVMGLGYKQNSNLFGFGGGTTGAFNPSFLAIDTDGKVSVNTTDTTYGNLSVGGVILSVGSRGGSAGYARMYYSESNAGIAFDAYNTGNNNGQWRGFRYDGDSNIDYFSDARLKTDIVDAEPMLDRLMQLPLRRFRWKDSTDPQEKLEFGVIAQEVKPLFPDIVGTGTDGIMTVGYSTFATIACKALQELKVETDTAVGSLTRDVSDVEARLQKQLEEKDEKISDLEARLSALEKLIQQGR